jgi:DnaJ-class molecular chaperone
MDLATHNLYDTLGISPEATAPEVKKAFRRLSLTLHPDKNIDGGKLGTQRDAQYTKLLEAYEVLSDQRKRAIYDAMRRQPVAQSQQGHIQNPSANHSHNQGALWADEHFRRPIYPRHRETYDRHDPHIRHDNYRDYRQPAYGYEGASHEDHSKEINDSSSVPQQRRRRSSPTSSQYDRDITTQIDLSLEECYTGCAVPIEVERKINGRQEKSTVYANIVPGTDDKETVVLPGMGHRENGKTTDLCVSVNVTPHHKFERKGMNLFYHMEITLKESLCGFSKELEHIDGKTYKVGSEKGKPVRHGARRVIPDKGFRRSDVEKAGNLIILFDVIYPSMLEESQVETLASVL